MSLLTIALVPAAYAFLALVLLYIPLEQSGLTNTELMGGTHQ